MSTSVMESMSSDLAVIPGPIGTSSDALLLSSRSTNYQMANNTGPGRLLEKYIYDKGGEYLEKVVGRIAHNIGRGPIAISKALAAMFDEDPQKRESQLDELYGFVSALQTSGISHGEAKDDWKVVCEKRCLDLINYTLPSKSVEAQVASFKAVLHLTTCFPGVKALLRRSKHISQANKDSSLAKLWKRNDGFEDQKWYFFQGLATHCLLPNEFDTIVETRLPSQLGKIPPNESSVIEKILQISDDSSESKEARMIAIRYVAGILRLSVLQLDDITCNITIKIVKAAHALIQDIDLYFFPRAAQTRSSQLLDVEGIDLFTEAALLSVCEQAENNIKSDSYKDLKACIIDLLDFMRSLEAQSILPRAYTVHALAMDRFLPDMPDSSELQDIEVEIWRKRSNSRRKFPFLRFLKQLSPFQTNDSKIAETTEQTNRESNVRGVSAASSDSYPSHSIPTDRESIFSQHQSPQSLHASERHIEPSHAIRSRTTSFSGESALNRSSKSRLRVPSRTFSLDTAVLSEGAQPVETASKPFGIRSPLTPLQSADWEGTSDDRRNRSTPSSISSRSSSRSKYDTGNSSSNSIRISRSFRQNERPRSQSRGRRLGTASSGGGNTPPPSTASASGRGSPLYKHSQETEETLLRVTEALNSNLSSGSRSFPTVISVPDSPPDYGLLSRSPSPELSPPLDK